MEMLNLLDNMSSELKLDDNYLTIESSDDDSKLFKDVMENDYSIGLEAIELFTSLESIGLDSSKSSNKLIKIFKEVINKIINFIGVIVKQFQKLFSCVSKQNKFLTRSV